MNTDPYSSPAANLQGSPIPAANNTVSTAAVAQLAATKPWVRFISVMTFIGAGLMLLAAVGMGLMGSLTKMPGNKPNNPFTGAMGFGLAVLYVVLAIVYVFPGLKLWKYANAIALLLQSGRNEDLVEALNQQRSFWKFVGILIVSIIALYIIVIIMAVFAGFAAVKAH